MARTALTSGQSLPLQSIIEEIDAMRRARAIGSGTLRIMHQAHPSGSPVPFHSTLRFDRPEMSTLTAADSILTVGSMSLTSKSLPSELTLDFEEWRTLIEPTDVVNADRRVYVSRTAGASEWGRIPCWHVPTGDYKGIDNVPRGPFLVRQHNMILEDMGTLEAWWTGRSANNRDYRRSHSILVPDYRAYFTRIAMAERSFRVEIHSELRADLFVACQGLDLFDRVVSSHASIRDGSAVVECPRTLKSLALFIICDEWDEPLDAFHERTFLRNPGEVLLGERATEPRGSIALEEMLAGGESPHVEYKHWTTHGDEQLRELAECVVAFANAEGGTILVGVEDHGEVKGTERLVREAAKQADGDQARNAYAALIRSHVFDTVRPRIELRFSWLHRSGVWILLIGVDPRPTDGCFIENTKDSFIRRGSTNQRLTAWDAAALSQTRTAGVRAPRR